MSRLTRERLEELFFYSDGQLFNKTHRGHNSKVGQSVGCVFGPKSYKKVTVDGKQYLLHRLIYFLHTGDLPKLVEHDDGDSTNCRIENLRPADLSTNGQNRGKALNNTSGYKGVTLFKRNGKWKAQIGLGWRQIHLGHFTTPLEAAVAYDNAVEKYFEPGFRVYNFPEGRPR